MNKGGEYNTMTARAIIESLTAERDALRELMRQAVVSIMFDDPWCRSCERDTEDDGHADSCPVPRMMAALAQPTDAGGA